MAALLAIIVALILYVTLSPFEFHFAQRHTSVSGATVPFARVATYDAIKDVKNNAFKGGIKSFGLANDGVGYQADNLTLPADVMTAVQDITSKIKSGSVTVPDVVP